MNERTRNEMMTPLNAITTMREFKAESTDAMPGQATITVQPESPRERRAGTKRFAVLRVRIGDQIVRLELSHVDAKLLGETIIEADRISSMQS